MRKKCHRLASTLHSLGLVIFTSITYLTLRISRWPRKTVHQTIPLSDCIQYWMKHTLAANFISGAAYGSLPQAYYNFRPLLVLPLAIMPPDLPWPSLDHLLACMRDFNKQSHSHDHSPAPPRTFRVCSVDVPLTNDCLYAARAIGL